MHLDAPYEAAFEPELAQGPPALCGTHYVPLTPFTQRFYLSALDEESSYNHFYDSGTEFWDHSVVESLPEGETAMSLQAATDFITEVSFGWYQTPNHQYQLMADWLEEHWL